MDAQQPTGEGHDARGERHGGDDLPNTLANGSGQDECLRYFFGGSLRIFLVDRSDFERKWGGGSLERSKKVTLMGTKIYPAKALLKMIFLVQGGMSFLRW